MDDNRVVQHMNTDIATKLQLYLNDNINDYLDISKISQDRTWASDAEVMASASLIGCDIVIYSKVGQSMKWLTHPASFTLQILADTTLYLENISHHFNVVINV